MGARSIVSWVLLVGMAGLRPAEGASQDGGASPPAPAAVTVQAAGTPITLDGVLDEPTWRDAEPIALLWETEPGDNVPARHATDCRITYDAERFYLGCRAVDDDPATIRAFLTDRDDIGGQDQIGILLDPFQDQRRAFAFATTPFGVQADFIYADGDGNDAWDAIWDSEGRRTEDGYTIEIAIPFRSLRFPAAMGAQSWNFYVWRIRPRSESVGYRSVPIDKSNQCLLCQMATATGFRAISPPTNVELTPTITGLRTDTRDEPTAPELSTGSLDDQVGLDVRWSVTPDLTLNATLNPDFSQVEADAQQLQSNQQFALFYQERRPFFLEGAELFQTPLRAVFTRSIADPSVGAKISGKLGGWAVGGLIARDEVTNLLFPGPLGSRAGGLEQGATTAIARLRRDVGDAHTVGALVTAREGVGYANRVAGVDARVQLAGPLNLSTQLLRSRTRYPTEIAEAYGQPDGPFGGTAAQARLDFGTRNWFGWAQASSLGAGFRADAGFMPQGDQRSFDWRIRRRWWLDDTEGLTRVQLMGGMGRTEDGDGRHLSSFLFSDIGLIGALQSELTLNPDYFQRTFEGQRFHLGRLNLSGHFQPAARVESGFFMQLGEELDFTNARASGLTRLGPWIDFRLGGHVNLELDYTYKRLTYDGGTVFREQIGEVLLLYYFSRRALFRSLLQVRDLVRDPERYRTTVTSGERTVATQLLLSYKLNPQSVLFLGYSDGSVDRRENEDPALGLVRMTRSFFVKLGYAWRP